MTVKKQRTKIEINRATSKWRFLDVELGVYSSEEWNKRIQAVDAAGKYRRKHGIK